jgi:hypothetical protein
MRVRTGPSESRGSASKRRAGPALSRGFQALPGPVPSLARFPDRPGIRRQVGPCGGQEGDVKGWSR